MFNLTLLCVNIEYRTPPHEKILIISSDQKALAPVSTRLQEKGHHVTAVSDVFTCLDTLVELTPDIIFLDLIMPQIQGDEVLRVLKKDGNLAMAKIKMESIISEAASAFR